MPMELDEESNPSQNKSLLNGPLTIVELNKKRKLGADLLGLPISKHQCWNPGTFKGKEGSSSDVSETRSGKDSNSCGEDSDSMSLQAGDKFGTENKKYLLYDQASLSSDWGSSSQGSNYFSDGTPVASRCVEKEVLSSLGWEPESADVELVENLEEESFVDYGSHIDHIYSGYGNYTIEEYQDKEIEEILNSNGANPNVYVLSSGRWSVNQDAPQTTRKPTIDQEFEQYFSMLML